MVTYTTEQKLTLANAALSRVIRRIQEVPEIRHHIGVCSSTFEFVTAAKALLEGVDVDKLREKVIPGSSGLPHASIDECLGLD